MKELYPISLGIGAILFFIFRPFRKKTKPVVVEKYDDFGTPVGPI